MANRGQPGQKARKHSQTLSAGSWMMRRLCPAFLLLAILFILRIPLPVHAETKVLTAEASYTMGDGESPSFAEAMVLQKAKQTALEQAGTYVESYTKVKNYDLTTEEIQTIAGGVLQVEIVEKKRALVGDGLQFFIKIKASVTTDKMEELARRIRGKNVAAEYKKLQEDYARLSNEIEEWKKLVTKTPAGPEREKALDQIREHEKAFAAVQNNEVALFRRLVSGEQLLTQGLREQAVIDRLFKQILQGGHLIDVGQPKVLQVGGKSDQAAVIVSLTLSPSPSVILAAKEAARELGGEAREQELQHVVQSSLLVGVNPDSSSVKASLVRVAKDIEPARYFQEQITKMTLFIEVRGGKRPLALCTLRYYGEEYFPVLPKAQIIWRTKETDIDMDVENTQLLLPLGAKEYGEVQEIKFRNRIRFMNQVTEANKRLRAQLPREAQEWIDQRITLRALSDSAGVFMRVAPVQSRLENGGLYGVGRPSSKLSARHEDNGFVAVLHDPATLKLEFILPQDQARQTDSIHARIVEMDADQWERINDAERCKVVR